jgi:16S rRNA G1207 methylase RsmC
VSGLVVRSHQQLMQAVESLAAGTEVVVVGMEEYES